MAWWGRRCGSQGSPPASGSTLRCSRPIGELVSPRASLQAWLGVEPPCPATRVCVDQTTETLRFFFFLAGMLQSKVCREYRGRRKHGATKAPKQQQALALC